MRPAFELGLAVPTDALDLATVHVTAWQEAYYEIIPPEKLATLNIETAHGQWQKRLEQPSPRNYLLRVEGKAIGFTTVGACRDVEAPEDCGELYSIYLLKAYWGQGWGGLLMEGALRDLEEHGFGTAVVWVLRDNARARAFYEHSGFAPDGATLPVTVCGDVTLPEVRYFKRL